VKELSVKTQIQLEESATDYIECLSLSSWTSSTPTTATTN